MPKTLFDDLNALYEAMIDWPLRLAHEEPFFRHWFDKIGVRSVVDTACGTGRHAGMFHQWGVTVEGADLSPAMIDRTREIFGDKQPLRWIVRGFDEPIGLENNLGKPFDAAICTGNSLALARDQETVDRALRQMFAAIRSGGIVIIHVLNLWQLPDGPCVWQKCRKVNAKLQFPLAEGPGTRTEMHDLLILKGIHRCGMGGYVDFLAAKIAEGKLLHHESIPFLGLEATQLGESARTAGAQAVHFFGDYRQHPYERETSVDLIMVAEKLA